LPLPGADYMNGYVQIPSYTPPDYELYHPIPVTIPVNGVPPIPLPQSALPFPLDPTRSALLGQLEYYLSSQNMAQDFFLRQRVSSIVYGNLKFLTSTAMLHRWMTRDGYPFH
jgi:la-related protein 1